MKKLLMGLMLLVSGAASAEWTLVTSFGDAFARRQVFWFSWVLYKPSTHHRN